MRANLSLLFALTTAATMALAVPADAQGKGKGKKHKEPPRQERVYEGEFREGEWYPESREYGTRAGNGSGRVPPGWCKGKGNPHNTPENCGYGSRSRSDSRYGRDGGSYAQAHADFHHYLDRKYSDIARQRPMTDIGWQLRVRTDKRREHEAWHARTGTRH